jgi:hypothetical protein
MKRLLRSIGTIVLAATVPVLVFGGPRGGGTCAVVIVSFLDIIANCGNSSGEPSGAACTFAGHPHCFYSVTYVNNDGDVRTSLPQVDGAGHGSVPGCRTIQQKICLSCGAGGELCPQD